MKATAVRCLIVLSVSLAATAAPRAADARWHPPEKLPGILSTEEILAISLGAVAVGTAIVLLARAAGGEDAAKPAPASTETEPEEKKSGGALRIDLGCRADRPAGGIALDRDVVGSAATSRIAPVVRLGGGAAGVGIVWGF